MLADSVQEQVRMYAKFLKIPTFAMYAEVVRKASQDADFGSILLELLKREYTQRQENQSIRRLKQAGFPFTKPLEELDLSLYSGKLSQAHCQ